MQLSFEMIKQMRNIIRLEGSNLTEVTQKPAVKRLYFLTCYPECRNDLKRLFPYLTKASQIDYVKTEVYKRT